jgi:apolipoprotein N-acyltransferase
MFAFAALWTAFDFISAFSKAGGAVATPAAAEVGAPMLMQTASLVGFLGITFLLGLFAAGIAASLRTRSAIPATIAVALFCANAAFGDLRMSAPSSGTLRVALIESDNTVGKTRAEDRAAAFHAVDAYIAEIEKLHGRGVKLIVMPENTAKVMPQWRDELKARLAKAGSDVGGATLVAGFNTYLDGAQRNVSFAFSPRQDATYMKRRLVVGLETQFYTPGPGPLALSNGTGLEICKDMDFHAMVREDMTATHPRLLAVPAWDFDTDDWSHARVAVIRSIENGVPMARTARDGLLTLNDRYGRVVARARTIGGFTTLVGDLPLDGCGGATIYDRIGDVFGWFCIGFALALFGWSLASRAVSAGALRRDG